MHQWLEQTVSIQFWWKSLDSSQTVNGFEGTCCVWEALIRDKSCVQVYLGKPVSQRHRLCAKEGILWVKCKFGLMCFLGYENCTTFLHESKQCSPESKFWQTLETLKAGKQSMWGWGRKSLNSFSSSIICPSGLDMKKRDLNWMKSHCTATNDPSAAEVAKWSKAARKRDYLCNAAHEGTDERPSTELCRGASPQHALFGIFLLICTSSERLSEWITTNSCIWLALNRGWHN